ncbi:MAG: threonine synthase [Fimbriimonadales bacterium]|nr:threonine synthase [Fimbriimonadales bacterium]
MAVWKGVIARYGDRMAIRGADRPVTLNEGNTPLIPAPRLARALGLNCDLRLKVEGANPTGSFKDRGMTAAVTDAAAAGARAVICASTGNTAASAAAYAARAGMECAVLVPDGKIAMGKLAGAVAYGARVVAIDGSFDRALEMVREVSEQAPVVLVNSLNEARIEGQKTAAWEIVEALGRVPDWLALPVGNAGNITAYWRGFREHHEATGEGLPRVLGAQAQGAAPIVYGRRVEPPETRATAIRIGNPARWSQALEALEQSRGHILAVTDDEIFDAYRLAASTEGVFCEPSSAAGLAGLRRAVRQGAVDVRGRTVVAVLTGHGLKDPGSALECDVRVEKVAATTQALLELMQGAPA